jgi:DNA ligase-1
MARKPLLAGKIDSLSEVRLPVLVQPKFDGIRCLKQPEGILSRAWKPIPNRHVQALLQGLPDYLDGELICGEFNDTQSAIMSEDGNPDFTYHVFDRAIKGTYVQRHATLLQLNLPKFCSVVDNYLCYTLEQVGTAYATALNQGFEGICLRDPQSPYKFGRSSKREGYLLKFKPFDDAEATIVGFEEGSSNQNPQVANAFGNLRRPGGRSGKVPNGTLGRLICIDCTSGQTLHIGSGKGLTLALRARIWADQPSYLGRKITYRFQKVGAKDAPRFPRFYGFRHDI